MEGALAKATSADELAKALGVDVISAPATSFMTGSLAFIGQDEKIIGTVLGTPVGKRSEVVEGKGAVAVIFVNNENQYDSFDAQRRLAEATAADAADLKALEAVAKQRSSTP